MENVTDVSKKLKSLQTTEVEALSKRGLDPTVCQNLGLKSTQMGGGESKVAQAYKRNDKVYAYKIRPISGKGDHFWIGDEGRGKYFYNEDCLRNRDWKDEPLIIVEGEFDCITAIQNNWKRCVSVPNGANQKSIPLDDERGDTAFSYLENASDLLVESNCKTIILATDGDESGRTLAEDLALRLGKPRCKFVEYPFKSKESQERCKDLNEVFVIYGQKGVNAVIQNSKWYPIAGVYKLSDLQPIPEPKIYRAGLNSLDNHFGIRKGDFSVLTGIPGHGKSTFVNDMVCRLSTKFNFKVAFASFEQPPQTDHKRNLVRWFLQKPTGNNFEHIDPIDLMKAEKWIDDHFVFLIKEDDEEADLDWVLDKMSACVIQHDCDMIVLDPYNEIDHKKYGSEATTDYVGTAIKKLKRFAKNYHVHLMVVAHPTKLSEKQDGTLPIPNLYNIEDSRHWYNKADLGVVIYRSGAVTTIRVAKSRYQEIIGKTGQVPFYFMEDNGKYHEAEDL